MKPTHDCWGIIDKRTSQTATLKEDILCLALLN